MSISHEPYMQRCLQLAKMGLSSVAPNPMVGSVLVYMGRIIGEGYHRQYGQAHAEVNCINSIADRDKAKISESTLYVSLEPCVHFGKTPPCTDFIIKHRVPQVVVGCQDPFREVNGKGIEKLKAAGIQVEIGILENECRNLNKRFFTFHTRERPFVILKWAQTADGNIASFSPNEKPNDSYEKTITQNRILISNEYSNRLVHKWRSEEAAILIGTNTALMDNPELTTRLWPGRSPVRLVIDMNLRLPLHVRVFNKETETIIFNTKKDKKEDNLIYYRINNDGSSIHQVLHALYLLKIQSVLVEGGSTLLQSFIDEDVWDEARVITNQALTINNEKQNVKAPQLKKSFLAKNFILKNDLIEIFRPGVTIDAIG